MSAEPRMLSAVLLTFNSERSIERTLSALQPLTADIHVVDSFSSDRTVDICRSFGCKVVQRPFANYADQRNWAIANLPLAHDWQIHLDADEELTPEAVTELGALLASSKDFDGVIIGRKIVFLGRVLRFGGVAKTWHCRVFRAGYGRCEDRLYDQHFTCSGKLERLPVFMLDHQEATLSQWTAAHNRWSDMEAEEVFGAPDASAKQVNPRMDGTAIERRRYYKGLYYRAPLMWRALLYFALRYIFQLGFLDGARGAIYHVLQGFWFRYLVDAKIYERQRT